MPPKNIKAIVIGGSAGAIEALQTILSSLDKTFPLPIAVVLHLLANKPSYLPSVLGARCALEVKEPDDKEALRAGVVYVAPPNYHLLIERQGLFSLSVDERVHFSRPSIDVLFESAGDAYGAEVLGVLLTGANEDGARGLSYIQQAGGITVVQSPKTASVPIMPQAGLPFADWVLPLSEVGPFLARLGESISVKEVR